LDLLFDFYSVKKHALVIYLKNSRLSSYAQYGRLSKGKNEEKLTRICAVHSGLSAEGGTIAILYLLLCTHL